MFKARELSHTAAVTDVRPSSPSHKLDVGVLLVVLGPLLACAMMIGASWSVVRRQMEDQSWAEERCDGLVPQGQADSAERWACLRRALGKSDLAAVSSQLALAATGAVASGVGALLVSRRRQRLSGSGH